MTSDSWFFHPELPPEGVITIDPQESRHATGSRRLRVGDKLTLFDGRGTVARCTIETFDGKQLRLLVRVGSLQSHAPARPPHESEFPVPPKHSPAASYGVPSSSAR